MDLADVISLADASGIAAVNTSGADIETNPPKYVVRVAGNYMAVSIAGEFAPVSFYNGPFERRFLGAVIDGVRNSDDLKRIRLVLHAYSVGRVVYFDGKQYPAKFPFILPFPTRDNIVNYIAVQVSRPDEQLADMIKEFFCRYNTAWSKNDHLAEVVCGESVSGTPRHFINHVFAEWHRAKYGGEWKIPGAGVETAQYVAKLHNNERFIRAITE